MVNMIRPSGSHEWFPCNGSQVMQEGKPNDDSDSTREGTACHWVAEQVASAYITPNKSLTTSADFVGQLAPNDVLIDEEMYQSAIDYVTDIMKYCNQSGLMRSVQLEQKLNLDEIYPGMSGTPDVYIWNSDDLELVLWDLKYGYGHVEVYENPQLMIYIAGILKRHNLEGQILTMITVRMRIFQPRSFHGEGPMREWAIKAVDLLPYFIKLKHAASITMSGQGQCVPGNHCRHCRGRIDCSALIKTNYNSIDVINGPVPMNMTGNNLALELQLLNRMTKLLKFRQSAVEKQVEYEIENGAVLPGFIRTETYGRVRWKKGTPTDEVLMMADLMGVNLRKPDNLDTPTQAKVKFKNKAKELGVSLDDTAKLVLQYSETPYNGMKVTEDDGSKLRQAFTKEI